MTERPKKITVLVPVELTEREYMAILQNSMERVFNTAIEVGGWVQNNCKEEAMSELGSTSWQDHEDLKEVTVKVWNMARNEVFKALNPMVKKED